MRLRYKILLIVAGILILVPTTVVYWIAATEAGLQFIAGRLGKIGPVTVTATDVRGVLTRGFTVGTLRIEHDRSDVRIEGIAGRIELLPLLMLQRVRLPQLHAVSVSVIVLPDDDRPSRWDPHFLPQTMRIDVADARIQQVTVTPVSGRIIEFNNLQAVATIFPKQIRVRTGAVDYQAMHILANGRVLAARPFGLEGDAEIRYRPEGLPEWQILAHIDGDLNRLPIDGRIQLPFHATVSGAAETLTSGWKYSGHAKVQDFDLEPFGGGTALGILSGELDITANARGYTASGNVTAPGLNAGPMAVTFDGAYADRHLEIRRATATHAPSGARGSVQGGVDLAEGGPRLALQGEWTQFRWPLAASEPAFTSTRGTYRIEGQKPWAVQADSLVSAVGYTDLPTQMRGRLDSGNLQVESGQLTILGGTATYTGEARWQPEESWHFAGRATNIDPAQIRADLPGELNFDYEARGAPFGTGAAISFDIRRLTGKLRNQNASGSGHFALAAGSADWQFRDVDLRLGRTHLELDGQLGAPRDLQFALDAEDLSILDPGARGRITARGRLAGTSEAPVLLFKARGSDFEWKEQKLATLNADVDIDLGTGRRTQGQVELEGLHLGNRTAERVMVQLQGSMEAQRILATVEAAPLRSAIVAEGVVTDALWQGQVTSLSVDDARNLQLRLEAPAPLQFAMDRLSVESLCLKGASERVCADAEREPAGNWRTKFSANALPLRTLTAGLTQAVEYEGTINLTGEARGAPGMPFTGHLQARLQDAELRHQLSNGREEKLALGTGSVTARALPEAFDLQVGLDAGASGRITGELNGQRHAGDWRDFPIEGSLDASTTGLGVLDMYVGGIDRATGRLTTNVAIGGTLGQPTVRGALQLRDARIDVYQVNLSLRELSLDARFDTNVLDLSGSTKIGDGTARVNGRLAWRDQQPYGDLHVEGENLRVVDVPEARIEASPNLNFKLAGRRIDVTGEVKLPRARLEPADLTNAVTVSGDEVLVGEPPVDPSQRWVVVSDIRLTLGEDVNINTLGLVAKVGGGITLRTDESQITRGQGELNITSGKYAALGRQLDVDRGRLIFNNGPVGDPGIDLRAQKVFPDVTAGVNVRGTLRAPRMTFYSEPAIPQSQIASLILAGGSLESVQNSNRSGAARNDLLAQGGAILAQQIGGRVGIEDVSIEQDLTNDTSLVLGRYLSPRFYVSYGISLAEAINTLKLRYTIDDHWTIKTEAGKARSADIVFTVRNPRLGKKKKTPAVAPVTTSPVE